MLVTIDTEHPHKVRIYYEPGEKELLAHYSVHNRIIVNVRIGAYEDVRHLSPRADSIDWFIQKCARKVGINLPANTNNDYRNRLYAW
jgi:hypothetical protein